MLDKFLGINSVTLVGCYKKIDNQYYLDTADGVFELLNELKGASVNDNYVIYGSFFFKSKTSYVRVHSFAKNDFNSGKRNNIYVVGEITKVNLRGTQEDPWADVLITIKHKIDDSVTSDIVKVILSNSSLNKINYDINVGDWLGVSCHKTKSETFALKVNSVSEHFPKAIRDFWENYKKSNY
ncbi:hypothetical protein [Aliivibrio fischeri]|uniref:hypothetical protein n=1 Tax=Aliivibrio fischeri TaxID=668 RepID=UPI0007C44B7F|nr:hypothetical protein [Aliivibrio fischeri]